MFLIIFWNHVHLTSNFHPLKERLFSSTYYLLHKRSWFEFFSLCEANSIVLLCVILVFLGIDSVFGQIGSPCSFFLGGVGKIVCSDHFAKREFYYLVLCPLIGKRVKNVSLYHACSSESKYLSLFSW